MTQHKIEKENLRRILLQQHPEIYEDLIRVFEIFQSVEGHLSVEEIQELLQKKGIHIDGEVISEHMKKIVELGFAIKKDFQNQPVRYEHLHLGAHHDHLICVRCGKIVEFEDTELETLQDRLASKYGFSLLTHRMELYGLCKDCKANRQQVMPLPLARPGERLEIVDIAGGRMAKLRLFSLGLRVGDEVEVISNTGGDGLIVARGDTRLALGKGIAHKVMVTPKAQ